MDKIAISSTKYLILGEFEVNCFVDKPDLIGSFFGQTEGLIGDDLEFQNLQKTGKLGRIDISLKKRNSKTIGSFEIPTALNKVEVSLVAAAIESIEKIGAGIGKIIIKEIKDVREEKRKKVSFRAEELLSKLKESIPSSIDLGVNISESISKKSIIKYGVDVWGGPDIKNQNEIILVEGRADVLNLLKHGISNVLSFGGSKISSTALKIVKGKIIILFLDGDNAAKSEFEMIHEKIDVDFVVFAPSGYGVEDLSYRDIVKLLKNKKEIDEEKRNDGMFLKLKNIIVEKLEDLNSISNIKEEIIVEKPTKIEKVKKNIKTDKKNITENKREYLTKKQYDKIDILIKEVKKNNSFIILNKDYKKIKSGNIEDLLKLEIEDGKILVFDGVCENSVYNKAKYLKLKLIVCNKKSRLKDNFIKIKLFDEFTN